MKLRSKAGFTLVELIVVIAILAILAGVAIPVYSGYIKKANEAADTQIVTAIDTAVASAMAENGFDPSTASTYLTVTLTNKTIAVAAANANKPATDVFDDFKFYYGDTSNAASVSEEFDFYDASTHTLSFTTGKVVISKR